MGGHLWFAHCLVDRSILFLLLVSYSQGVWAIEKHALHLCLLVIPGRGIKAESRKETFRVN